MNESETPCDALAIAQKRLMQGEKAEFLFGGLNLNDIDEVQDVLEKEYRSLFGNVKILKQRADKDGLYITLQQTS